MTNGLIIKCLAVLRNIWTILFFQEYSYSTANMFTAVICALFFPDKFTITVFILFSMGFLFAGIYCYEKKTFRDQVDLNSCHSAKEKGVKWSRYQVYSIFFSISLKNMLTHKVLCGLNSKINFVTFVHPHHDTSECSHTAFPCHCHHKE